jgi:hypothetical protein
MAGGVKSWPEPVDRLVWCSLVFIALAKSEPGMVAFLQERLGMNDLGKTEWRVSGETSEGRSFSHSSAA